MNLPTVNLKLREVLLDAQARYNQLAPRERRLVTLLGGLLVVFVLFLTLFTFSMRADATRRRIADKLKKLEEAKTLAANYREAEAARQAAEKRLGSTDVRLITFIEEKGNESGLEIPALNPRGDVPLGDGRIIESSVVLDLTDITLPKLTSFLQRVEAGPGVVKVKYLRLEPRPSEEKISVSATVAAYHLKP